LRRYNLVLPAVTPSSWHQLLTYSNRAVFNPARQAGAYTRPHFSST